MAAPTRPVPDAQQRAFELAVAERLGIDPESAVFDTWRVEDGHAFVQLKHILDPDELLEMFNTGKSRGRSIGEASARLDEARADLQRAVDQARERGSSWSAIGAELGITKQTAWEKFGGGKP